MLTEINYSIKRSNRKSLSLQITEDAIEVKSPYYLKNEDIHRWVVSKSIWIEEKLLDISRKLSEKPDISHGGRCLLYGAERTVLLQAGCNMVRVNGDKIIIEHRDNSCPQNVFEDWLKAQAIHYLRERCLVLAKGMCLLEKIHSITFRKTKSKWGHCTSEGKIQFNWLIIMAPVTVVDYLIVHELCHLKHMNHSRQYWLMVQKHAEDFKTAKRWLKDNSHKIWL